MKTALTIAGSDSSGGAGIQADIKTMTMHGVFAMTAVTALTAQNTLGVTDVMEATPEFLAAELDAVFTDIFPDAVKTGMVSSSKLIHVIVDKLKSYKARNIVVDPVMVATNGAKLICDEAIATLRSELLPIATVITPNIPEAEVLTGIEIKSSADMEKAASQIFKEYGCAVLLKGGHDLNDANDLLWSAGSSNSGANCISNSGADSISNSGANCSSNSGADSISGDGVGTWFYGRKIDNPNTHGTGCTLSSAVAANLALGLSLEDSVKEAKEYISMALADKLDLGHGKGPMNHAFKIQRV